MKNLILLAVSGIITLSSFGQEVIKDGIRYDIINNEYAIVGGIDKSLEGSEEIYITLSDYVTYSDKNYAVKEISKDAFKGCKNLKMIYLANVEKIGDSAFENSEIEAIALNDKVKEVGTAAFACCNSLQSIYISGSIEKFGSNVFNKSNNIKTLTLCECNETYLKNISYEEMENITIKSFFNNVLNIPSLDGILFSTKSSDMETLFKEIPELFQGMEIVELSYTYPDDILNVEYPSFITTPFELPEGFDNTYLGSDKNIIMGNIPNAVWPNFSIAIKKDSSFVVLCPADQMTTAPAVKKKGGQFMGFNEKELEVSGFGIFYLNDPTDKFMKFMKPTFSEYYKTPEITSNSRLIIGTKWPNKIENIYDKKNNFSRRYINLNGEYCSPGDMLTPGIYIEIINNETKKIVVH